MHVCLNGRLGPQDGARVSVFDRGFLYGDGVFETIRVAWGRCVAWARHWERLASGADRIGITLPSELANAEVVATDLVRRNGLAEGVLRLQLTRGAGTRGYSPRGADAPTWVMTTHPLAPLADTPHRWRLRTASMRLGLHDVLSPVKHGSRLVQILARAEAEALGADEALLLNARDEVVEAASANVFWIEENILWTPPLSTGCLPGVTRGWLLDHAADLALDRREAIADRQRLAGAEAVFLTLSTHGVVEAISLDDRPLRVSPVTHRLQRAFVAMSRRAASDPRP